MIDINTIGVGVETKEVKSAARDLDSFGKSADNASRKADGLSSASKKSESALSGLANAAKSFGLGIGLGAVSVTALGAALLDTAIKSEKLSNSLKFSTGSANAAAKEIEYLKKTTNELGLEFLSTSQSYAKFSAATKGTALEGQKTRDVFEAIAKASTVLGLSADESSGALLAISQMMSKGTVSAEELRGQLGERLPGAFQIAAKSMNVTTAELGKMLEQGQIASDVFLPKFAAELTKSLGDNPQSAAGSAQAQLNKLSNAWLEFKKSVAESGVITIVVKLVEGSTGALNALNFALFGKAKEGSVVDRADKFFTPIGGSILNAFGIETAQQKSGNAARRGSASKNNLFPGVDFANRSYAPNFNTGIESQDINKIHKQQEELDRANKQSFDKQRDLAKKAYDEKLKQIQDEFEFEDEIQAIQKKQKLEGEEELRKEKEKTLKAWADLEKKNLDEIAKEREKAFEAEQRQLEKLAEEQKEMAHEFSQALTNGLFDSFKKGESFGKAMLSNLLALAKTWAARLFDGLLSPIGSSIASVFTGGAASMFSGGASAATGGGSSSIFSGLSSIGSLFSKGNAAIVSSIESLGTFLSTGTGGLGDLLGGALGQYAGQIANVLPFAGAAFSLLTGDIKGAISQSIGTGIGLAIGGPVGGIVGAVASSLLGGLGGKHVIRKKFYANASVGSDGTSILNAYGNSDTKGSERAFATGPANSFANAILQYSKAFGASVDRFNLGVQYQQKYDSYLLTIGKPIGNGSGKDLYFKSGDAERGIAEAFLIAIKKGFVNLPEVLVDIVKRSTLGNAINDIESLSFINQAYKSLKDLPPVFEAIGYSLKNITLKDVDLLKSRLSSINTYTSLFYTQAEQFDTFTKQIATQFDALNTVMPKSRDEYRKLVDGIKVTDESTSNLFYGLVALAPAMDTYFKQLQAQADELDRLNSFDINSFTSLAEYRAYKGVSNNYGSTFAADFTSNVRSGAIGFNASGQGNAGGNLDLVSLLKELRDIAKQTLTQTADGTSLLQRFDRAGMPTRV